jgi:prepilin-type N-terminal cleavage/methylation domain-containing protein
MQRDADRPLGKSQSAFTLVELLIVVAIIAILATIAIPNMLEAQVRSKAARAAADVRSLATALEAYHTDYNNYPPTPVASLSDRYQRLAFLTTPVAFMTGLPLEVFTLKNGHEEPYAFWNANLNDAMKYSPIYYYLPDEKGRRGRWVLFSRGPDRDYEAAPEEGGGGLLMYYDPTNGSVSNGDIMRFGP